jgi:hypothetical protein
LQNIYIKELIGDSKSTKISNADSISVESEEREFFEILMAECGHLP